MVESSGQIRCQSCPQPVDAARNARPARQGGQGDKVALIVHRAAPGLQTSGHPRPVRPVGLGGAAAPVEALDRHRRPPQHRPGVPRSIALTTTPWWPDPAPYPVAPAARQPIRVIQ
jgi:hypothetical protein